MLELEETIFPDIWLVICDDQPVGRVWRDPAVFEGFASDLTHSGRDYFGTYDTEDEILSAIAESGNV